MTLLACDNATLCDGAGRKAGGPLIVFAGGGSGGHLYPALAVADALRSMAPDVRVSFFATEREIDGRILADRVERVVTQRVRPLTGRPWRWPGFWRAWRESMRQCRSLFAADEPAVVIGTGGFASGPAVAAAARCGIPTALLNPDLVPGKANRWLASRVQRVFVQWPESASHFGRRVEVEVTGCPTRSAFAVSGREQGIERFELTPDRRTLLVTGASQGARTINEAMVRLASTVADLEGWQVLHLAGPTDVDRVARAYAEAGAKATVLAYTEFMAEAMAAADLVVSRAGASTLAEIAAVGVPSILVPYPHHRDQHQLAQARLLVEQGAARVCIDMIDGDETATLLREPLLELMTNDETRLAMRQRAVACGAPRAAEHVAARVLEMAVAGLRSGRS